MTLQRVKKKNRKIFIHLRNNVVKRMFSILIVSTRSWVRELAAREALLSLERGITFTA